MPRKKMTEKTHYKESPHDERIEELALDIEATKNTVDKRENFWRCFAVFSAVTIFSMAAWGMNRGSVLWGETLAVARIQEERSSDALAQFGKQSQIIAQLREELVEQEKKLRYEQNLSKQLRQKGQKLGRAAHNLLKTMFPPDSTTRPEKTMEWIAELTSATRRKAAQSLVLTLREDWDGYGNTKASDIATAEEDEFPKE